MTDEWVPDSIEAIAFRESCEYWLPKLGTAAPVIPISQASYDWLASLTEEERDHVGRWVIGYAVDYGHIMKPQVQVIGD